MGNLAIIMEYSNCKIMDIYKLMKFKTNLEKFKQTGKNLKMVFYGDYTDEELAVYMAYFNNLVNAKLCDFAISFKSKEMIIETGINNRALAKEKVEVTENNINDLVKNYYKDVDDLEIRVMSNDDWENLFSRL
jgi:hypothetical protein